MKFLKLLPLLFLLHSAGFAHPPFNILTPKEFNIFIHPVAITSHIRSNIYLTYQVPLGEDGDYHIIINPSFLISSFNKKDYSRYGSGIGFRRFIDEDFYVQIMPSMFYLNGSAPGNETISGSMVNVLGYVGYNMGYWYFDAGLGYGWAFLPKTLKNYSDFPYHLKNNRGLAFDINFGVTFLL
jgi:hypothetical protein